MQPESRFLRPLQSIFIAILSLVLTGVCIFLFNARTSILFDPGRQQLLVSFAIFLSGSLAIFCLQEHYRFRSSPFLVWGLGLLLFSVFNMLHILTLPGAAWSGLPASLNDAIGYQSVGQFLLVVAIFVGLVRPPSVSTIYEWASSCLISAAAIWTILSFSGTFLAGGEVTLVKRIVDGSMVGVLAATIVLLTLSGTRTQNEKFWLLTMTIVGLLGRAPAMMWNDVTHLAFYVTQIWQILFLAVMGITIVVFKINSAQTQRSSDDGTKSPFASKPVADLLDDILDGVLMTSPEGEITFANQKAVHLFGYSERELIQAPLSAMLNSLNYQKLLDTNSEDGKPGSHPVEIDFLTKDNRTVSASVRIRTSIDEDGDVTGVTYFINDRSQEKAFEARLQRVVKEHTDDLRFFQQCIQYATEGIIIVDKEEKIAYVNTAFEEMSGYRQSDLVGKETQSLAQDQQAEAVHKEIWQCVRAKKVWRGELGTRRNDGTTFLGQLSVVPIAGSDADDVKYLWVQQDVTRRKTLEKSLQEYAEKLTQKTDELEALKFYHESLIEGLSDILIVMDNEGKCIFLNKYGSKRLGRRAEEITRADLPSFFDDLVRLERDYGATIKLEIKDFEAALTAENGETFICSWYATPLVDRTGAQIGAMAVARDISGYKTSQRELKEQSLALEKQAAIEGQELRQRIQELNQAVEIGKDIQLKVDLDVIMNKIADAVHALGWNKVLVWLANPEKAALQVVATAGLTTEELETVMGRGDIDAAKFQACFKENYRTNTAYMVPGESGLSPYQIPIAASGDNGSEGQADVFLVPIRDRNGILGTIMIQDSDRLPDVAPEAVSLVESLANQAVAAVTNEMEIQKHKENDRRAEFIAGIGKLFYASLKLDEVVEAVVLKGGTSIAEFCAVLLEDGSGQLRLEGAYHHNPRTVDLFRKGIETFPVQAGEGAIGLVATTQEPLLASFPFTGDSQDMASTPLCHLAEQETISSIMAVPLRAQGNVFGIMLYLQLDKRRVLKQEKLVLAQELADRAGLAFQNAFLFKEAAMKAQELEKANRLKSEFLANVSHELRTPLNAIITLSDILTRRFQKDEFADEHKQLNIIRRSGQNLLSLIDDILDLSKIEAGKAEPIYTSIPIRNLIEETVEHIRPLCLQKGLELHLDISPRFPKVLYSDQEKLTKALTNVLSNAVKFTRSGRITVKAGIADRRNVKIQISDTGIGIPTGRLDEIFKEFHQVESSDSRSFGGTGLGLAITKNVISLLGGTIDVRSQLGKGSTFTLNIPIKRKKDLPDGDMFDPGERLAGMKALPFKSDIEDDRYALKPNRKTVLVVDDEAESLYIIAYYLRQQNYQIVAPHDGEETVSLAKKFSPFAVILDVIMPQRSGWEILRDLKEDPETADIPVIMASILSERARALEMGADEYLVKPFKPEKLHGHLAALEKKQRKKVSLMHIARLWTGKTEQTQPSRQSGIARRPNPSSKILLVDDDSDSQYALQLILENAGYEVAFATEGRDAVRQAEALNPNLILMDIMMPGMDGYEATRTLRRNERLKNVPIVAVTAKAMKGDRERTLQAGCDDYVAKPFVTEEILRVVEKWAERGRRN